MTLRFLSAFLLASLPLVVACSSSSSSDASGSGTLSGVSFTASAAVASGPVAAGEICEGDGDGGTECASTGQESLTVTFTNRAAFTCNDSPSNFANLGTLAVTITESGSIAPGTYAIGTAANGASAAFSTTTASCGNGQNAAATSGSVTLTHVAGGQIQGSVSLMFGSSPFKGTFDVVSCTSADGGPPADAGLPVSVTSCVP